MENKIDKKEWKKHFMDLLDSSEVVIGTGKGGKGGRGIGG